MRALCLLLLSGFVVACSSSSSDAEPFTDCAIGELTGTWRVHYTRQDGDCPPKIPDETVVIDSPANKQAASKCTFHANNVAADKCSMEQDFTCPAANGPGSLRWTGKTTQTSAGSMRGTMSLTIMIPEGTCRSTYTIDWTKL